MAPRKRAVGKPRHSPARMKAIISALQLGNYISTSCGLSGVATVTHHSWRTRGERELDRVEAEYQIENMEDWLLSEFDGKVDPKDSDSGERSSFDYMAAHRPAEFSEAEWIYVVYASHVERARAYAEARALNHVRAAMPDSWQAAAWFLERTQPDKYGRRDRINHEGVEAGTPVDVRVSVESLEQKLMRGIASSEPRSHD